MIAFFSDAQLIHLCEKAESGHILTQTELRALVQLDEQQSAILFACADRIRQREVGDDIHLRGLIEFSNICIRECQYCGLYCRNKNVDRYRMKEDEIVETAQMAKEMGYPSLVLQSGEDPYYNAKRLAQLIQRIKDNLGVAITLSAGEFTRNEYKMLHDAGVDRYLLRFETSDEQLYRKLHPDSNLSDRLKCLDYLTETGYQVGTGFMVGLPGETPEIFADNLLLLKKYNVGMVGIGPFLPNPDTPLSTAASGSVLGTLKAVALTRLLLPDTNIPATTALGTLDKAGREKALQAGANVIMPNVSPMHFRELYKLYPNKMCVTADQGRTASIALVESLGRTVGTTKGHAPLRRNKQNA
jgi:biotin synthase